MNKLFMFTLSVFLTNASIASNYVYCPDSIQCSKYGDVNSCKIIGGDSISSWKIYSEISGKVESAGYSFTSVSSFYEYDKVNTLKSFCSYSYESPNKKIHKYIALINNDPLHFEASLEGDNSWEIYGYHAYCQDSNLKCPMKLVTLSK